MRATDRIILALTALLVPCPLSWMERFLSEWFVVTLIFDLTLSILVTTDLTGPSRWVAERLIWHKEARDSRVLLAALLD